MTLERLTQITSVGISSGITLSSATLTGVTTLTTASASGNISAVDGTFSGDLNVAGTLTYEDVSNIDSVGIITARSGIHVTGTGANGRIGIGTDNPTSDLQVVSYGDHGKIRVESSGDGNRAGIEFFRESSAGTGKGAAGIWVESETGNSTGELRFGTANNASLQSFTTKMIMDVNGNIGIGTETPDTSLRVVESYLGSNVAAQSNDIAVFERNDNGYIKVLSPNDKVGGVAFGDTNDSFIGAVRYDHDDNNLNFYVNNAERLRITSSGRLGIGSEAPTDPLDIADNDPAIRLTDIDGQVYHRIRSSSQDLLIECDDGAAGSKPNLRFQVGNDEKFRVTGVGGSFGIGTNDPQTRFHVNATIDDNDAPQWAFHLTQDDPLNSFNQVGGTGIGILFKPATNSDPAIGAGIAAEKPGASDDDTTTDLVFYTSNNDEVLDERLRVKSNGTVYMASGGILAIGAETAQMSSTGNVRVTGDFYNGAAGMALNTTNDANNAVFIDFGNSAGGRVGEIDRASSTTVAYRTSSDYRLKENVVPFTDGIERVKRLNPVRYSWIVDEKTEADQDGFLAHEVQDVVPIATGGTKDQVDADGNIVPQGIDHSLLVPLLTAALQEAVGRIETLEAEVAALKAQ